MGENKVPTITIQYNGLFDFDGLYVMISDWAKNYGFHFHERDFKHKVSDGAEQEIWWDLNQKVNEFVSYKISIEVHTYNIVEQEIDTGTGKKKPMSQGRIKMILSGSFITDWQKKFSGSKFAEKLGKWYDKLKGKDLDNHGDLIYYRMQNLNALIKKYLDMQTKKYAYKGYLGEG